MDILKGQRLILASKSPRRSELLTAAGIPFEVFTQDVDESIGGDINPYLVAEILAKRKGAAAWELKGAHNTIVLSADSVVILDDNIFEKPKDAEQAFNMLAHLSGKTHTVVTGVALKSHSKSISFSSKTMVTFRPMNKEEINFYISEYQPFDKAGAYGIQDWIGMCKVSEIQGTYSNVMGLPVDLVYEGLKQMID